MPRWKLQRKLTAFWWLIDRWMNGSVNWQQYLHCVWQRKCTCVCLEREWGRVEGRKKEGGKERDLKKQWGKVIPQQRKLCFQLFTGQFYHWHLNPSEPLSSITFFFPAGNFPSTSLRSRGRTHGGLQTLWHRPPSRCLCPPFPLHFFPYDTCCVSWLAGLSLLTGLEVPGVLSLSPLYPQGLE